MGIGLGAGARAGVGIGAGIGVGVLAGLLTVGNEASGRHVLSRTAAALARGGALRSSPSLIPMNKLY